MFDKKDYKGVLAAAPAVLTQAQGLTAAAAAKKTETMDMYAGEWSTLASSVPQAVAAIQSRVDILSKSKKLPAGMDAATLDNVKTSLAEANSTWAQATEAQAAGDLEQAVTLAQQVKTRTDELLTTLGHDGRLIGPHSQDLDGPPRGGPFVSAAVAFARTRRGR